jgi:hypothetical protein
VSLVHGDPYGPDLNLLLAGSRTPAALRCVVDELLAPGAIGALVERILRRPDESINLATSSYDHPNGFEKLVLHEAPSGQKVALHVWWPATKGTTEDSNLHDHRWHFATAVLVGGYRFVEYVERSTPHHDAELVYKHSYESPAQDGRYRLELLGQCRVARSSQRKLGRGDVYVLRCDVIHRISPSPTEPTITLFVQGAPVQQRTRIYSPTARAIGDADAPGVERLQVDGYTQRLQRALTRIAAVDAVASGGPSPP